MYLLRLFQALAGAGILLSAASLYAKPIYKCQVNGTVQFSEEKCDEHARPIELKGLSAPLKPIDMEKLKILGASERIRKLESRIDMRQKRISHYRKRMNAEIRNIEKKANGKKGKPGKSYPKGSVQEQETSTQLKNIADSVNLNTRGTLSEQINSVVLHYQALVKAEEFQISILLEQLRIDQQKMQNQQ